MSATAATAAKANAAMRARMLFWVRFALLETDRGTIALIISVFSFSVPLTPRPGCPDVSTWSPSQTVINDLASSVPRSDIPLLVAEAYRILPAPWHGGRCGSKETSSGVVAIAENTRHHFIHARKFERVPSSRLGRMLVLIRSNETHRPVSGCVVVKQIPEITYARSRGTSAPPPSRFREARPTWSGRLIGSQSPYPFPRRPVLISEVEQKAERQKPLPSLSDPCPYPSTAGRH